MAATKAQIAALYVGYFNRGADPEGLNYWLGQTQMSVVEIANSFAVQPEAKATYAYLAAPNLQSIPAIDAFITEVYQNVFERAPDAAGLVFWRNEILNGKPPGRVVVDIESGAVGDDKIILDRKTEVSAYYAEKFALSGDVPWTAENDLANAAAALDGDRAFWLSANAVSNAKAHVDQLVAASFAETLNLTPAPDDLTGTSADDVFNGAVEQTAFLPIQTLNTDDSLDGGGGRNTLNAQLVDPFVVPEKLANIQVVNINQPSGLTPVIIALLVPVTLDVVNANAIDTINFRAPVQDITIASVTTALTDVSITDNTFPMLGGRVFTITHVGTATDGADDALDIALRNDNVDTELNLVFQPGGGYETINIDSTGPLENRFELNASPRDLFIGGDADLRIRGDALNLDTLRKFNSEELEGPARVDARFFGGLNAATAIQIDTGEGGDRLVFSAGTMGALTINTNNGADSVDLWEHTGNVTANLGDGDDYFEVDGTGNMSVVMSEGDNEAVFGNHSFGDSVTGNVVVTAGAGNDDFYFEDIRVNAPGSGNVTADAGNGNNYMFFHEVEGLIDAKAGTGNDEFDFDDVWFGNWGTHTFGAGDKIDGGGGANVVRFEVESNVNVNRDLITGGTIVNVQTAQHHGSMLAGSDLLVDFEKLGSVMRLELQGVYSDDVHITNLNNTDGGIDTVAVQNSINDQLSLERAFVTIPAFQVEIGDAANGDSVVIGELVAGFGTDLITITSVGAPNEITDVSGVNGNVVLKGTADIDFGAEGFGNSFGSFFDAQTVDARGASGNDEIWTGDGHQTILDGAGDDFFGVYLNGTDFFFGPNWDSIELAGGANTIKFFDVNGNAFGGSLAAPNIHQVSGTFNIDGAEADRIIVDLDAPLFGNFDTTDGNNVANGASANIREVQAGDLIDLSASGFNFLKFTTAVTGANTVDALFDDAIGGGLIGVDNGCDDLMAAAYDATRGEMVIFAIDNSGSSITAGDDADGIASIAMTYDQFLAFNSNNFGFTA